MHTSAKAKGTKLGQNKFEERIEAIRQRGTRSKSPAPVGAEVQSRLPFWPEPVRGLPNPLARSDLFTVGNRAQPRQHFKNKAVASTKGVSIVYRGEELRQDDEDVFLQILHVARDSPLGESVELTGFAVLKALGWGRSQPMYERLKECLLRLKASALTVSTDNDERGFSGSLIRKFAWQGDDGTPMKTWKIWLEPELIRLFGPDTYTQIYWEQRLSLSSPLAKWLHGYYYTHREPYAIKVETIKSLCGSKIKTLSDFRKKLKLALDSLKECGFLMSWQIDASDLVHVVRGDPPKRIRTLN